MIYVLGSKGQLGQTFALSLKDATFLDRSQVDLSNLSQLEEFLKTTKIRTLINTGAYTQVDKAESERELALRVNGEAPTLMAKYSSQKKFKLVHFSTDYVFNGTNTKPYNENDKTDPVNFYGASKLAGEEGILSHDPSALIFRTSWVYSNFGNNFYKTMARLASEKPKLRVVSDQRGTPTYTVDLVKATEIALAQNLGGLFHFSNEGETNWFDFAVEILKMKGISTPVEPIPTSEYPTPAKRPHYSVLDKTKFTSASGMSIPDWKSSLKKCLADS